MPIITQAKLNFIREPLMSPFGFKGGSLNELWQIICAVEDDAGNTGTGLGVQSVLWSDPEVFSSLSPVGGDAAMFLTTQYALSLIQKTAMTTPPDMIKAIFPAVYAYACQITRSSRLQKTFVLNALVGLDFALWQLFAKQNNRKSFTEMTREFTSSLTDHHDRLGIIPLITYGMAVEEIRDLARRGCFFFKVKLGQNPGLRDDPEEMLEADRRRILEIHAALKDFTTPYTDSGHLLYYFDANGRYDNRERLLRLLQYMESAGVLSRTVLFEEPFAESLQIPVFGLPVRIAGDESAHSPEDVRRLIDDLGYGAIALKPIAKTLSLTLDMLNEACKRQVPCFCADLTVNPVLSDWNRNVACRIAPLPGLKIGVMESNGAQNYRNWEQMKTWHPAAPAPWLTESGGLNQLGDAFYQIDGGILLPLDHYRERM